MHIIKEIENYIELMKSEFALQITLHPSGEETLISGSELMKYNFHMSAYCTYLKSNPEIFAACVEKQKKIHEKLKDTERFSGICHAGVAERVYRLAFSGEYLGFLSVGGYSAPEKEADSRIMRICEKYGCIYAESREVYKTLNLNFPNEARLDSLILPLCRMIEYGNSMIKTEITGGLYPRILGYLNLNFLSSVSVERIAEALAVSPSVISHTFKKHNGKSISEHLLSLRISYAEHLLLNTEKSIADIALLCGFSDSSYFCRCFKKCRSVSPLEYRFVN